MSRGWRNHRLFPLASYPGFRHNLSRLVQCKRAVQVLCRATTLVCFLRFGTRSALLQDRFNQFLLGRIEPVYQVQVDIALVYLVPRSEARLEALLEFSGGGSAEARAVHMRRLQLVELGSAAHQGLAGSEGEDGGPGLD